MMTLSPARRRGRGAALLALLLAAACGDGPSAPPPAPASLTITVDGRLERGLVVTLAASAATGPVGAGVQWSAEPAGAVAFLEAGRARLLQAGTVTLRATAGEATGTLGIDVALPPLFYFEAPGDAGRTLYAARLDGTDLAALAVGPGESREPTAAGGQLVYVTWRHGNGELYRLPLAGGTAQRLTTTTADEQQPALAPDGSRLAFVRTVGGVPKLFTAQPDATGAVRAAPDHGFAGAIEGSPSWAPAGDRLVFMSTAGGRAGIYTLTLATGAVTPLLTGLRTYVEPAWSPDGRHVAFVSSVGGGTDIFLYELATGTETRLTNRAETDGQPAWLPDGRLLYTSWTGAATALRWLDPADPDGASHEIPLAVGRPERAAAAR